MGISTVKLMRRGPRSVTTTDEDQSTSAAWLPTSRRVLRVATSPAHRKTQSKRKAKPAPLTVRTLISTPIDTPRRPLAPQKRRCRGSSGYQGPEHYAHLPANPIRDSLAPNLLVLVIGLNPGVTTALKGRAYSGRSNHFWRLLHESGLTTRRLCPEDDQDLPHLFAIGLTTIVSRPTRGLAQLSKEEMAAAVSGLVAKVRRWRPEIVIMAGKAQYKAVFRATYGRDPIAEECQYGWVDERKNIGSGTPGVGEHAHEGKEATVDYGGEWNGARVFIAPSPSGASPMFKGEREAGWRAVGEWVQQRRAERDTTFPARH